jgi:hypothetical protein
VISINGSATEKFPQLLRCKVRCGEPGLQKERGCQPRRPISSISELPPQFADPVPLRAVCPATGFDGALKPHDCLVDPAVMARRIGLGFLTTDRSLDYALLALMHHVADRLGSNQATVTALSMTCR